MDATSQPPPVSATDMDRSAAREPRPNPCAGARAFLDKHAPTLAEQAWPRIAASAADYGDSYLWTAR